MKLPILSTLLAMPLISAALLPRQDPRVDYPDLPQCFGVCFQLSVMNTCGPTDIACFCENESLIGKLSQCIQAECKNAADVEKAIAFGVGFCQAGGVEVTPSLTGTSATTSARSDGAKATSAGDGIATIPAGEATVVAVDKSTDLGLVGPSSVVVTPTAGTSATVTNVSPGAPSSIAATVSNAASGVISAWVHVVPLVEFMLIDGPGSASSAVSSAAATAGPSNGADGLVVSSTGLLAGVLAVVFAL
ncbi:hypothetical protein NCC49_003249 [Naganishia albida]|nr:hypothetical protein NCC49_003249 [Naganishia albida]